MKTLFISILTLLLLTVTAFPDHKFIYGPGFKGKTFSDDTKEFMITQTVGVSTEVGSIGFGLFTPDEAFLLFNYGRAKAPEGSPDKYIGVYEGSIKGIWNLSKDTTKSFIPFFHAKAAYEIENSEENKTENIFSGDFGLGAEYKLTDYYGLHLSGAAKISDMVSYEGFIGLYFSLNH